MHSFCMLTFVFVPTGTDIVLARITGIFVANVSLIVVPLCTEHMPLRQDTWTHHACAICDKLEGEGMCTRALQTRRHSIWLPVSAACAHTWPWACSTCEGKPPARSSGSRLRHTG